MVEAIREFFDKYIKPADAPLPVPSRDPVRIAAAALLIEMTRMDDNIADAERVRVQKLVQQNFGLGAEETAELLRIAETQAQQATDYFQFTTLIRNHMSPEQKEQLIEMLWEVAYADGELHPYEEHLVRKIADLLYVSHDTFIAAKLRARHR
jgi:uncharacterized tellurite resistance protein B-like protein